MKLTKALIDKIEALKAGKPVPYSSLKGAWVDELIAEQVLTVDAHKSRRVLRAPDAEALLLALPRYNEALKSLSAASRIMEMGAELSRGEQVEMAGNSKIAVRRTCPGFLVNAYSPIAATLNGKPFTISPPEGSFVFIADWQAFSLPSDTLVVGIENMENFKEIRKQRTLFEAQLKADERSLLFASRYPQSTDLCQWLKRQPNRYLHFGDFDLAGISIFQTEFEKHLGARSSFLIPTDIEARLPHGSAERYDSQYARFHNLHSSSPSLQRLIDAINKYRRGYDQEGYISY